MLTQCLESKAEKPLSDSVKLVTNVLMRYTKAKVEKPQMSLALAGQGSRRWCAS